MAGASILRNLTDADLEALHHMIRRDAMSDLAIARWAEKRLQAALGAEDGALGNDQAAIMVVARYRASEPYRDWLKAWLGQDMELKKSIELQKQRFELLRDLVGDGAAGDGMEAASRLLQSRLMTLAAALSDEELAEASGKNGWVKNLIKIQQDQEKIEKRRLGEQAAEVAGDGRLTQEQRQERIREIFGK